ncbi:hypothetical protein H9X84_04015 [Anaerotignum lactatifermentans]|nr:hypothetical protein [Anaerotignum lactatifermentans]
MILRAGICSKETGTAVFGKKRQKGAAGKKLGKEKSLWYNKRDRDKLAALQAERAI